MERQRYTPSTSGAHKPELVKALEHIVDAVIWISKVDIDDEPRDVIQIKKLRDTKYSSRKYFFNADDEGASLEEMKKSHSKI